ncbi:hypothetical protein EMPS_04675 [Entomortierella parvispora]|uniref:Periplasmic binding protein n=1 Tax=Entomortierella parvispora TaxID=205924 RepID=A0A9P3H9M4_9FUNG|nr:hypothetical protein EMPS_04675 [Entomortierella parvispora]
MISLGALLLLAPFVFSPVAAQQGAINSQDCVQNYDANVDYFPSKIHVDDAALFKVHYEKNYKVVTVVSTVPPVSTKDYILTQCGTPVPDASKFANGSVFVSVPVTNAATIATTPIAFIEMLGRRNTLKLADTENLVSSPCVQYGLENNQVIGLEDKNLTLRAEQFASVDVVFSSYGAEKGTENKTVITSEVLDPGPLNRAEWLEFYSTFFNLEESAQNLTATINNNYNCFKKSAIAQTTKPVIAWTSYIAPSAYNKNTASWTISPAPYKQILSTDAGATFFNGTSTATPATFEDSAAFLETIKPVDIIIDETMSGAAMSDFLTNYNLTADADFKFLKNKAVYRQDGLVNPNDGREWFGSAVVQNDAVLQDVIRAVHPQILPADVPYNWIRNIAKNEAKQVLTAANCTAKDASTPVVDRALVCSNMKVSQPSAASKSVMAGTLSAILGLLAAAMAL